MMNTTFTIDVGSHLSVDDVSDIIRGNLPLGLSEACRAQVADCRNYLEQCITDDDTPYYGINTGFGYLYNVRIADDQIEALQANLVRSHAAGAGDPVPQEIARMVLVLKIISLARGSSGVRVALVEQLIAYHNAGLTPVMYMFGSLGASGDLAPLAHLSLTLMGEGAFYQEGQVVPANGILGQRSLAPLALAAKEGLALINGTQFSTGYAVWAAIEAQRLLSWANLCGALACDAFDCNLQPFDDRIHQVRPHPGQVAVARVIRTLLEGSEISSNGSKQLQDPYAFRCIPQVHGATMDTLDHARAVIETELNAVTDNPLVFPESSAILSGGNFHGQPIALVLDFLAIALAELGNISERRTYQLISGDRNLPTFLAREAGLQSGLMLMQYTAASIVNKNKILCTPASIDSIVSSKGQEDHVSMSANSATKLYELCINVRTILAIEFMVAMQALDYRAPQRTSPQLERIKAEFRKVVPFIDQDTVLQPHMVATEQFLSRLDLKTIVQS